jgi:hypothetical protein
MMLSLKEAEGQFYLYPTFYGILNFEYGLDITQHNHTKLGFVYREDKNMNIHQNTYRHLFQLFCFRLQYFIYSLLSFKY